MTEISDSYSWELDCVNDSAHSLALLTQTLLLAKTPLGTALD